MRRLGGKWQVLILLVFAFSRCTFQQPIATAIIALQASIYGSCSKRLESEGATSVDEFLGKRFGDKISFVVAKASRDEVSEYERVEESYTWIDKQLADGISRGQPTAVSWAARPGHMWQLTADHPRNNKTQCLAIARSSSERPTMLYASMRRQLTDSFLVGTSNVVIHDAGFLGMDCGYLQLTEGCETMFRFLGRKWWKSCDLDMKKAGLTFKDAFFSPIVNPLTTAVNTTFCRDRSYYLREKAFQNFPNWTRHDRVFVIAATWDHNYHHFMIESLLRLLPALDYLRANPDVMIHIRRFEVDINVDGFDAGALRVRTGLTSLLGLEASRFIGGPVVAKEAFTARGLPCNMFMQHAVALRRLVRELLRGAMKEIHHRYPVLVNSTHFPAMAPFITQQTYMYAGKVHAYVGNNSTSMSFPKRILIQRRVCRDTVSRTGDPVHEPEWRCWNDTVFQEVVSAFRLSFPRSEILTLTDTHSEQTRCLACELVVIRDTDMLVGVHGAGMTNALFQGLHADADVDTQTNSRRRRVRVLVEVVGVFDGRMLPVCGYHGPLAAIAGVHHMIHYYDSKDYNKTMDAATAARRARKFYQFLSKKQA